MTESNGITTLNSATSYLAKPTSCGRAVLNVQLRIVNDDDVEVPIGNPGEVLIRGPTVMKGLIAWILRFQCQLVSDELPFQGTGTSQRKPVKFC
jgi:acyl-coenzyme A synthetase/AMP-(fatty) acid ligase